MISFHNRYHFLAMAVAASILLHAPAYASFSVLDAPEVVYQNLSPFKKWTSALQRKKIQFRWKDDECGTRTFHPCAVVEWKELVANLRAKQFIDQITAINDWGNEHPYIVDQLNWGMADYWATPYEFMAINGDCEDYAIAKYFSLRALGVPADQLRIMIVQDMNLGGIIHAILGVRHEGTLWILDNQIKELTQANDIYHYRPIYAVNEEKWWRYVPEGSTQ